MGEANASTYGVCDPLACCRNGRGGKAASGLGSLMQEPSDTALPGSRDVEEDACEGSDTGVA